MAEYTPERVEQISGVRAADIRMLADLFGDRTKRITSLWCMGMNQHTRGTAINALVHGIHLLLGPLRSPGRRTDEPHGPALGVRHRARGWHAGAPPSGGSPRRERRAPQGRRAPLARARRGASPIASGRTRSRCSGASTRPSKGGDIETLWVQVTNPGQTMPNDAPTSIARRARQVPHRLGRVPDATTRAPTSCCPRRCGSRRTACSATRSGARSSGSRWSSRPARRATTAGSSSPSRAASTIAVTPA
jgi:anaerobic selenocysteine-containing dehydrogenase